MAQRRSNRARNPEPTAHVDLEYPSSVPTFTVNPTQLSSSSSSSSPPVPTPWFSAFGRTGDGDPLPPECDPKYSDPAYYSSANYGKGHRNTSHTAKKPEGHIKRPPNCFLLFRSHVKEKGIRIPDELRPILKERLREKKREGRAKKGEDDDVEDEDEDEDDHDDDEQSVSKISGILWDFLPAAEKSIFRARAAHAKAQHKQFYPTYKYSPQVKDKTVKKRIGKKMAADKRERLEEAASLMAAGLGWVQPGDSEPSSSKPTREKRQRTSPTGASTPSSSSTPPTTATSYPGSSSFPVSAYSHQPPPQAYFSAPGQQYSHQSMMVRDDGSGTMNPHIRGAHAINGVHDSMHLPMGPLQPQSMVPMSAVDPHPWSTTGLGMGIGTALRNANASTTVAEPAPGVVRMARRTSSCPPPGAHLTWENTQGASSSSTPAHGWNTQLPSQHVQSQQMSSVHIPQQPIPRGDHTFVRPGGKTARKMRSGNGAKGAVLGGQQNPAADFKANKKRRSPSRPTTSSSSSATAGSAAGGMTLPSVPNVMRSTNSRDNVSSVPMTALTYDPQSDGSMWTGQNAYEFPASATSSPTTFDSSAPPSVLLETPPFGHQLPQLQLPPFSYQHQQYSFPAMGDPYYANSDAYSTVSESYAPVENKPPVGDGQLGLTVIDDQYQFPPSAPRHESPVYDSARERTPRTNTLPTDPLLASPHKRVANNWGRPERPSPLSPNHPHSQTQGHGQDVDASSGYPIAPHGTPAPAPVVSSPTIVSPSPVTPIPISMQQQQAEYHHSAHRQAQPSSNHAMHQHHQHGLDQLGVEVNLSVPEGGVGNLDPDSLAGLLEFSFPNSFGGHVSPSGAPQGNYDNEHGGLLQEGYSLSSHGMPVNGVIEGSIAGNVLLGDVALGVHDGPAPHHNDNQHYSSAYHQHQYQHPHQHQSYPPVVQDGGLGPLDIPLHELYSAHPTSPTHFDPSTYIADDVHGVPVTEAALNTLSSSEALEYDMMEWRRNSGSNNNNNVDEEEEDENASAASSATVHPGPLYSGSRRASVQLGNTYGGEMAMALYGFDAASSTGASYHHSAPYSMNMSLGMEFEFQQGPPPLPPTATSRGPAYPPSHPGAGPSPSTYAPHMNVQYPGAPPLGTVLEERERSPSSEEGA